MGLFDFSSQKWKRELLHHQGWDTVTWVQQLVQEEDEEKETSRTGCWKGVSTSLGSKFLPAQAEVSSPAAMQHQHVLQPSCGCTRRVCGACAGYQLSVRSWTCHCTRVPCGTVRVPTALLPAPSLWFSLPRAKILQLSVSHQLESCCVYFNHPQLLILSPEVLLTAGTSKVSNARVCITGRLEILFCGSFQKDVYSIGFLSW